jgi:signal transduction histidine kinase
MRPDRSAFLKRVLTLFEIPEPQPKRLLNRIELMERNIMIPLRVVFISIILYSLKNRPWMGEISSLLDVTLETFEYIFWFYILASVLLAVPIILAWRWPLAVVQWTVFTSSLVDALLVAGVALITGGLDSVVFWLFLGLIVRNAISVPPGFSQLILNFAVSLCYVLVAVLDTSIISNLDETTLRAFDQVPHEELGEPFFLRLVVLWLATASCYGVQAFLERQRVALDEAEEFAVREGQLRAAGRLSAEFAHQIKNPLAIINNAAFVLQKSVRDANPAAKLQIDIIREEVARADRVINQIMEYGRLGEGRIEKLFPVEELDRALAQVFPPGVMSNYKIHRKVGKRFPPLLMQRNHLSEILLNLLQNAREACPTGGNIYVEAACLRNYSTEFTVRDSGPGIPSDKLIRVFEAYYTTKEKGTGLGLAIVKHNIELYEGKLQVESELGKGAKFTVIFPARTLPKILKK